MAMKHSDLVAAVCCHAGALLTAPADDYIPTPIWFVHGTTDAAVLYNGTDSLGENGLNYKMPGAQVGYDYLSSINGCTVTNSASFVEGNIQYASNCTNNADVELMTLTGVGHSPYKGSDTSYDTTALAWEFCSSHEFFVEPVI